MDGLLCSSFPFVPGYSLDASGHLGESSRRSYHHWLMLEILISVQQKSAQDRKMTSIYSVFERKYFDVKHFRNYMMYTIQNLCLCCCVIRGVGNLIVCINFSRN